MFPPERGEHDMGESRVCIFIFFLYRYQKQDLEDHVKILRRIDAAALATITTGGIAVFFFYSFRYPEFLPRFFAGVIIIAIILWAIILWATIYDAVERSHPHDRP